MSAFGHFSLQTALYDALSTDSQLSAMVTGIYSHVPGDTLPPYVVLGRIDGRDWAGSALAGMEYTVNIHAYSAEAGNSEALAILARVYALLHGTALTVSGQTLINLRMVNSTVEQEKTLRHGVMRFRAVTQA